MNSMPTKGQFATLKKNSIFFPKPSTQYFTIQQFSTSPKTNAQLRFTTIFDLFFHSFYFISVTTCTKLECRKKFSNLVGNSCVFTPQSVFFQNFKFWFPFPTPDSFQHMSPLLQSCPANKTRWFYISYVYFYVTQNRGFTQMVSHFWSMLLWRIDHCYCRHWLGLRPRVLRRPNSTRLRSKRRKRTRGFLRRQLAMIDLSTCANDGQRYSCTFPRQFHRLHCHSNRSHSGQFSCRPGILGSDRGQYHTVHHCKVAARHRQRLSCRRTLLREKRQRFSFQVSLVLIFWVKNLVI